MGTNIAEMQSLLAKKDARIRELEVSSPIAYDLPVRRSVGWSVGHNFLKGREVTILLLPNDLFMFVNVLVFMSMEV